ncbi:MAG: FIST C-terminal domain-containing protein [Gemmatimonadaceae bacterium]|nr:FIST C-terminal domain-containing protein [Gemmatimonadaceae bacterium]
MSLPVQQALSVKTGTSQTRDPHRAAEEFFQAVSQPGIKLVQFYCSTEYDLPELANAMRAQFGDIPVVGCTTAGEITPVGYLDGALTGFSLAGDDVAVVSQLFPVDPFDSAIAASQVSSLLDTLGDNHERPPSATDSFGFLLVDGLSMQEESVVSCIHQHLRGIDLIGGSAGDATRFQSTHLYFAGEFHTGAAVLTIVRTDLPFVAFRTQHFVPSANRMVVTGADPARRTVHEINGKPALAEYARIIGLAPDALTQLVFATYPVMVRIGGQNFVRSIGRINDDGSLQFFCAIDEGIVLTIASGVDFVENLEQAFDRVHDLIGPPQLVLGCDCLFRRLEMDRDGIRDRVSEILMKNNVIGFTTYGEQYNAMHVNQTFTGIAIGRPA